MFQILHFLKHSPFFYKMQHQNTFHPKLNKDCNQKHRTINSKHLFSNNNKHSLSSKVNKTVLCNTKDTNIETDNDIDPVDNNNNLCSNNENLTIDLCANNPCGNNPDDLYSNIIEKYNKNILQCNFSNNIKKSQDKNFLTQNINKMQNNKSKKQKHVKMNILIETAINDYYNKYFGPQINHSHLVKKKRDNKTRKNALIDTKNDPSKNVPVHAQKYPSKNVPVYAQNDLGKNALIDTKNDPRNNAILKATKPRKNEMRKHTPPKNNDENSIETKRRCIESKLNALKADFFHNLNVEIDHEAPKNKVNELQDSNTRINHCETHIPGSKGATSTKVTGIQNHYYKPEDSFAIKCNGPITHKPYTVEQPCSNTFDPYNLLSCTNGLDQIEMIDSQQKNSKNLDIYEFGDFNANVFGDLQSNINFCKTNEKEQELYSRELCSYGPVNNDKIVQDSGPYIGAHKFEKKINDGSNEYNDQDLGDPFGAINKQKNKASDYNEPYTAYDDTMNVKRQKIDCEPTQCAKKQVKDYRENNISESTIATPGNNKSVKTEQNHHNNLHLYSSYNATRQHKTSEALIKDIYSNKHGILQDQMQQETMQPSLYGSSVNRIYNVEGKKQDKMHNGLNPKPSKFLANNTAPNTNTRIKPHTHTHIRTETNTQQLNKGQSDKKKNILDMIMQEEQQIDYIIPSFSTTKNKDEVAHTPQTDKHQPRNYKTQLCKYFLSKTCTRGSTCNFSHDTSQFPCKAFHLRNNCTRTKCQFSHEKLSDDDLARLKEGEEVLQDDKYSFVSTLQFN